MTSLLQTAQSRHLWRLRAEFGAFFILTPAVIALALPPERMFSALFASMVLGLFLLHITADFRWQGLVTGFGRVNWRFVGLFTLLTIVTATTVVLTLEPDAFLILARTQPALLLMIMLLYPIFSALPQELVFRPLFFRRYQSILPEGLWPKILLNAALFSWAHLMYWHWVVLAMTFFGGLAFAYSYEARRNFPETVVLHAISGNIVFALGLGLYFYSGNVARPF
ncbi:type II CAAX prenyl endopeptidase Rce1 family protein [Tropicimonas sp. S265A]|uniref:CPBP family glutamic-type intramembrane protease n=1 Tax=Tropicimonas sp. S265A TaxID=3415134 RepID=UPI003C79E723